ncbi:pentapeptide repeat-containing protein [Almyronema epifaneia]
MNAEELLEKYATGMRDFEGIHLSETHLVGATLTGINLKSAKLNVANLSSVNLSHSDLSYAKLNVTRLSGANLSQAKLHKANLNVTNLIRAILVGADLSGVSMIRAELLRAELSNANLQGANLSESDLREVRLRWANLMQANLGRSDLRNSILTAAILKEADLHAANLSRADLSGTVLVGAELRHANLRSAKLVGANLRGANLRWADLSGADLREADLTDAKLSGANLTGANLAGADLYNTSLVHADLSQANLIAATCVSSNLTGATLTGSKLYATVCSELRTTELTCDWIDLSTTGDRSQLHHFQKPSEIEFFFNRVPPQVIINVDAPLTQAAHLSLAKAYATISQHFHPLKQPPSILIRGRKTTLTFQLQQNDDLFIIAYLASLPFQDYKPVEKTLSHLIQAVERELTSTSLSLKTYLMGLGRRLTHLVHQANNLELTLSEHPFGEIPIQLCLVNSNHHWLEIYQNPRFGIRGPQQDEMGFTIHPRQDLVPELSAVAEFIRGMHQSLPLCG